MSKKPTKTISIGVRSFYCENCNAVRYSTNTTLRIYVYGVEVQVDHCETCGRIQETEFIKGPTVRYKNKE